MKINWKIRLKNKTFWLTAIPALLLIVRQGLSLAGIEFDASAVSAAVTEVVESLFILLTLLGIVNDPTTAGVHDSCQALEYTEPKKEAGPNE